MADEEGNNAEAVLDAPGGGGPDAPVGLNVPGDQIAALQDQLQALKLQYASAQASFETQLEAAKQPKMTVVAQAVPQLPKVKTFTGLAPASPQEATFSDWHVQMREAVEDESVLNKGGFVRRHLRGPALHQVASLGTNDATTMLAHLSELFGDLKIPDDRYIEVCQMRPMSGQRLQEHLLLISQKMEEIQRSAKYVQEEYNRRLYLAFSKGCSGLVALELRNKWGVPGEGSPTFAALFRHIRQIEDLEPAKGRKGATPAEAAVHALSATEASDQPSASGTASPSGQTTQRRGQAGKGYCFKCGLEGHMYRACRNPPNAALVGQREVERRQRNNVWRKRQGLPELPLN